MIDKWVNKPYKIRCNRTKDTVHFNLNFKDGEPCGIDIHKGKCGSCVHCLMNIIIDLINLSFEMGASKVKVANRLIDHGCGFPIIEIDTETKERQDFKSCLDKFGHELRKAKYEEQST